MNLPESERSMAARVPMHSGLFAAVVRHSGGVHLERQSHET